MERHACMYVRREGGLLPLQLALFLGVADRLMDRLGNWLLAVCVLARRSICYDSCAFIMIDTVVVVAFFMLLAVVPICHWKSPFRNFFILEAHPPQRRYDTTRS